MEIVSLCVYVWSVDTLSSITRSRNMLAEPSKFPPLNPFSDSLSFTARIYIYKYIYAETEKEEEAVRQRKLATSYIYIYTRRRKRAGRNREAASRTQHEAAHVLSVALQQRFESPKIRFMYVAAARRGASVCGPI